MQNNAPASLPPPTSILFARGVLACLAVWPALRVAVENSWGGPGAIEKRTWLASVIVDSFEEQTPVPDAIYIEEILHQVMADEFETSLEDGSAESVAADIVKMWDEVHRGRDTMVLRLEEQAEKLKGKRTIMQERVNSDDEWEESDSEMEEDEDDDEAPVLIDHSQRLRREASEVDEDGFTLVKGKGKKTH